MVVHYASPHGAAGELLLQLCFVSIPARGDMCSVVVVESDGHAEQGSGKVVLSALRLATPTQDSIHAADAAAAGMCMLVQGCNVEGDSNIDVPDRIER